MKKPTSYVSKRGHKLSLNCDEVAISPPPWVVATRTCFMRDVAIASARFACVRLLLFARRIYSKFFGEHACAWIKADKNLMWGG